MRKAILIKEHGEIDDSGLHIDLGLGIAVKEPCRILRFGVKVGINLLHPLDQPLICFGIGDPVNKEDDMILGPRRFAVLRFHVVAARIEKHRHIGKLIDDVLLRDPVFWIIGVCIVAVHHKRIGKLEIRLAAVVVFEANEGMVVRHQPFERIGIRHCKAVGVDAVCLVAAALKDVSNTLM